MLATEFSPKAGDLILIDTWPKHFQATILKESDWPKAAFVIGSGRYDDVYSSINIQVTGKTLQQRPGMDGLFIRIRIEFVREDEPNTETRGWLRV